MEIVPNQVQDNLEILKERHEQLEAYNSYLESLRALEDQRIESITAIFEREFDGKTLTEQFKTSIRRFLQKLPYQVVYDAMEAACHRFTGATRYPNPDHAMRYFCGICWKKVRGEER